MHFRRGPPTIFRKHMPSGMGTESLGMIRCIFAENGPLEGGIEARLAVPVGVLRGDFRWIFGLHPYIFEGGLNHYPKAHALRYRHRKFGDDRMYIRGEWAPRRWHSNQVSGVPVGVLRVIPYVILTYTRTFSNREPIPFSKAHALSYTHSKVGNDQMHIRGEITSGKLT